MKIPKVLKVISDITTDLTHEVLYFARINAIYAVNLIDVASVYWLYMIGQYTALERGTVHIGLEVFIPVICYTITYYVRETLNRFNKGNHIPVPSKRFTEVHDDGEVSIVNDRLQELILYMADLEDFLERKKWL